jgi:hypothetical protein
MPSSESALANSVDPPRPSSFDKSWDYFWRAAEIRSRRKPWQAPTEQPADVGTDIVELPGDGVENAGRRTSVERDAHVQIGAKARLMPGVALFHVAVDFELKWSGQYGTFPTYVVRPKTI